jgi:hypothetical protein
MRGAVCGVRCAVLAEFSIMEIHGTLAATPMNPMNPMNPMKFTATCNDNHHRDDDKPGANDFR